MERHVTADVTDVNGAVSLFRYLVTFRMKWD